MTVIMNQEKTTAVRVLGPGDRVSLTGRMAGRWANDDIASCPDAGGKAQASGKKARGGK